MLILVHKCMFGFIDCSEFDKINVSHDDFLKATLWGLVTFVKSAVILDIYLFFI